MTHHLGRILRVALVAGCLLYVFWNVDAGELLAALGRADGARVAAVAVLVVATEGVLAARLYLLAHRRVPFRRCVAAALLCLGLNNLFPAKLGELAKMLYLHRLGDLPFSEATVVVAWERFFDLNVLVLIALAGAYPYLRDSLLVPVALVLPAVWVGAWAVLRYRDTVHRWLERLPYARVRTFLVEAHGHLDTRMVRDSLLPTLLLSVLVWTCYAVTVVLLVQWVFELGIGTPQALVVFVVVASGAALPSSPGALGVYEAAAVLSLGWFGVAKEPALAAALVMHAVQYLPTTLLGLAVLWRTPLRLEGLRRRGNA